jgi:hypothetical protein
MKSILSIIVFVTALICFSVLAKGPGRAHRRGTVQRIQPAAGGAKKTTNEILKQLDATLNNAESRAALLLFCKQEFSCENINFLLEVNQVLRSRDVRDGAVNLVAKYAHNGANPINLPFRTMNLFESIVGMNDEREIKEALSVAREEIRNLVGRDTFGRFLLAQSAADAAAGLAPKGGKQGLKLQLFGKPGANKNIKGDALIRGINRVVGSKKGSMK